MRIQLVFVLICSWLLISHGETDHGDLRWAKTNVRLFNKSDRHSVMVEHCWSSDDDLGPHTVTFDQYYEFSFRPNFWGSTKFMCKVMFNNDGNWKNFYGYIYFRDSDVCAAKRTCDWTINEAKACRFDGFCITFPLK
ncbi:hypothetical protein QQ045_029887 [Rhodiola kirilowii]